MNKTFEKWEKKTLEDILDKGSSNLSANKLNTCEGDYPVYGASGLVKRVNFYQQEKEYLAIIKDGAGVGRVYHYEPKSSILGTLQYLFPKENVNIRFAYYYLQSLDFAKYYQGAAIPHIYYKDYKNEKLVLPPLPEQQRIIEILDEAFENIAKSKQNALQNLNNAKELFENCIEDNFTKLAKLYPVKTLSDIAVIKGGKRLPKGQKLTKEITLHPYLRVTDFTIDGTINTDDLHYISDNIYEQIKNYTITSKDLYITIVGATIGKSGIIPKELDGANLTENACKLIFNNDVCNKYVYYFTKTKSFNEQSFRNTKITAVPKLALTRLATIKLPISSVSEQQKIVAQLDELQEQTKKLKQIYEQKIKDLDELKQSILQKAFNGEL